MNKSDTDETITFQTQYTIAIQAMGAGKAGQVEFQFFTPKGGPNYMTVLSAELSQKLSATLAAAVKSVPTFNFAHADTPGNVETPKNSVTFFAQEYDADVLVALGMLMVRANLLERALISLFSALTSMSFDDAEKEINSATALVNKIAKVRKAVFSSGIALTRATRVNQSLEKAKKVAIRRNHLVHAQWSFEGTKIRATTKKQDQIVTAEMVHQLAADYRTVTIAIESWAGDVINEEQVARERKARKFQFIPDYRRQHAIEPPTSFSDARDTAKSKIYVFY